MVELSMKYINAYDPEIARVLEFSLAIWKDFGFTEIKPYLATRPAKAVGDPARWTQAMKALEKVIEQHQRV